MTNPTIIVPGVPVGRESQRLSCPACHAQITTITKSVTVAKTHIAALILFICLCWPCIPIPYCTKCCKNIEHYCPNCQALIGTNVN
ncbi:uncharacterized protein CBL_11674 [Carabus blaptoides fortunei]